MRRYKALFDLKDDLLRRLIDRELGNAIVGRLGRVNTAACIGGGFADKEYAGAGSRECCGKNGKFHRGSRRLSRVSMALDVQICV